MPTGLRSTVIGTLRHTLDPLLINNHSTTDQLIAFVDEQLSRLGPKGTGTSSPGISGRALARYSASGAVDSLRKTLEMQPGVSAPSCF